MEDLTMVLLSILIFCLTFSLFITHVKSYQRLKQISQARRVLLVTAHPDDETMFFGPSIMNITRDKSLSLFLLCMSNGNYQKNGRQRKEELYRACKIINIEERNIIILSYTKLQDNPAARWREEIVSEAVLHVISSYEIDTVLTFDRGGVSGHPNHASLYNAMVFLMIENRLPQNVAVFTLQTVNVLRKYSSFLDIPMSFLLGKVVYMSKLSFWYSLYSAMGEHTSQFVWYRKLYVFFSRYMLINTYEKLNLKIRLHSSQQQSSHSSAPSRPRRQFQVVPIKTDVALNQLNLRNSL